MTRRQLIPALSLVFVMAAAPLIHADVKKEEKSLVTFTGILGRLTNLFGGRAAKEGVVSTVAVSGDRKMTTNDTRGEIIDLKEEKVYTLDMRRKTYTVMTFEEMRRKMAEMQAKAKEDAAKAPKEEQPPQNQGKEIEIDFDVKNTGQTKTINGFDTRQVIVTVTVREKGQTLEAGGGLVMTVDNWLTRSVPALKEIAAFDMRYYKALAGPQIAVDMQQMATALAMFPGLKDAFARVNSADLDGTAIAMTTTVESVKSAEQMKQEQSSSQSGDNTSSTPTSVGGAIGGFMRRRAQQNSQNNAATPRTTFMTINNEVLKIATNVTPTDVAMPAGFKLQ